MHTFICMQKSLPACKLQMHRIPFDFPYSSDVCMYVHMYVCVYACTCMYVCMYYVWDMCKYLRTKIITATVSMYVCIYLNWHHINKDIN